MIDQQSTLRLADGQRTGGGRQAGAIAQCG